MMRLSFFIFFLSCSFLSFGQKEYTTDDKRAIKFIQKAMEAHREKDIDDAEKYANKAIGRDAEFVEAYLIMAGIYFDFKRYEEGIEMYKKGLEVDPDFYPNAYFDLAKHEFRLMRYKDAVEHLEMLLEKEKASDMLKKQGRKMLKNARFGARAKANPVPFDPENLGPKVNSKHDEYWPSLSADEQTLVFTRRIPIDNPNPGSYSSHQEDFFITFKKDSAWTKAENMGPPINTPDNEGAQALSVDGKSMFFTACNRPGDYGRCDIYYAAKKGNRWGKPYNIGAPVNTKYSEKQPGIAPDGKTLYFASDRNGTKGKLDIWMTQKQPNSGWSEPQNLGDNINTPGHEMSPFIHPDGQTMYFASEGHTGMGGFDLYYVKKDKDGDWGEPVNMGYPINTSGNEEGLMVNARGNLAFYSSNRDEAKGIDLFRFELYEEARPTPVSYMKGKVYDAISFKPLGAHFELIDIETGDLVVQSESDDLNGTFLITIPVDRDYALNVSKEGYLFYSENFSLKEASSYAEPYIMDIPLQPIREGESIVLKNIFYETDKYELKTESKAELNKVVDFLRQNPGLKIEIGGHTDSVGTEVYNKQLSENRAKGVVDYLVSQGVDSERLSYKGYGETEHRAANETEKGRAQNRRTELKVIEYKHSDK